MPEERPPTHPLGTRARVLLSSVFGPYARDDAFGSRRINPMELYQNQVTRVQGGFSLRMFHRSFGLMMIQQNLEAPCTLLDFPSRERFIQEITEQEYDIVGISAILPNIDKVREMCRLIRIHCPSATIVVGGHIAGKEGLAERIDTDYIVRGEGIRWFQRFLGQSDNGSVKHPLVLSGFGARILGINLPKGPGETAAILIPSVGCPMGCNFCSTSAHFGGKGKFVNFFETGDDLFAQMCAIEEGLKVRSFFVLDENFLLHRKRALRLLELMERAGKVWALYVFSSARVLTCYTIDQLVRLGIGWVWMGLEGEKSAYGKLNGVDTKRLVCELQSHGIRVLGSSIIGLEDHRSETIEGIIDYAICHDTVFHQFMLYTPVAGTPLYEEQRLAGTILPEEDFPFSDAHGQYRFNYRHRHIPAGQEEQHLLAAFEKDFIRNGPSILRLIQVLFNGWKTYRDDPRKRVRQRVLWETRSLPSTYAGAVWAIERWYRHKNPRIAGKASRLLHELYSAFGWKTRLFALPIGLFILRSLGNEEKRLAAGWTYEPTCIYEINEAARTNSLAESKTALGVGSAGLSRTPVPSFGK